MQEWQRQKGSKGKVFAVRPRPVPGLSLRGGCTPGNSRRVAARDKSRLWQLAVARAHREASARARGLHPRQFAARGRAGQVAPVAARFARAHREASARPRRSASAVTSRLGQLAVARAHRIASARARRGWCAALPLPLGCVTEKAPLSVSIPQKETRPAAVAAGLSLYRGAPGRYSISQQSSHTPS